MKIKSITAKLCLLLTTFIITISIVIAAWSIKDTNKVVQAEMGKLNREILDEVADNISIFLSNIEEIGTNIVEDNKINSALAISKEDILNRTEEVINLEKYVDVLLNEQVWKYGKYMKPDLYIVSENDFNFSTYSKNKYTMESIKNETWYSEIVKANGKTVLLSTFEDEEGIGPFKSIFRMGRSINNLITGDNLGVLIMDISEKMLFDRYNKIIKDGKNIYIVDLKGNIISNKDKRLIGKNYFEDIQYGDYIEENEWYSVIKRDNANYIKLESTLDKYGWSIIEEIPSNVIKQPIKQITEKFILTLTLVIVGSFIIIYKLSIWITKPVINMKNTMKQVMDGNLNLKIEVDRNDEIGSLEESFNNMIKWLEESIEEIKEQEKQKRIAELSFLQAQINPHFLYNTLSGVRFLVSMNKNEEAEEMIFKFTKLLRNILPKASELISLNEEIEIVIDYIELQKIRYPNLFKVDIFIQESIKSIKVPALILQPVVENAIFYSIDNEGKKGKIRIIGYSEEEKIIIEVIDNGKGMSNRQINDVFKNKEAMNRVGLINVHERIQLNYGKMYGIEIISEKGKGTRIRYILPKKGDTI
ncbi:MULTISPECIES: cache domain-containing sensor histidine kinase [unclassified Clostridium]|uniref:cache domain-containing sensor histidine kinase n=1 Tax=unclassified Clostridium TaxID=2614128 RepID=UPI0025C0AF13|nr:sensor histidine kinase [Clostridium sp.]MCI6692922.1 sensor histidine kinase [Clostridium sp.]MDY4253361.1 sensor histidine kinase [Clostridium sp.]MDY6226187.1 sensor histidine kinase [Clostridium sp.]